MAIQGVSDDWTWADMIIYYSGTEGRYGEAANSLLFSNNIMMTFDKIGKDRGKSTRFWELLKQRSEHDASAEQEEK